MPWPLPSICAQSPARQRDAPLRNRFSPDDLQSLHRQPTVSWLAVSEARRKGQPDTRHGMPCEALQTAASVRRGPQFTICAANPRAAITPSTPDPQQHRKTMKIRPKYITFDCYGTLTRMRMGDMAREMFADRIPADRMEQFLADF